MSAPTIKTILFDVFGTVVDWRTSLIDELTGWARSRGIVADWAGLVDAWRGAYVPSMNEVRNHPERGFIKLDDLHRKSLDELIARFGIQGLSSEDRDFIASGWHRLKPWPDSVPGLTRLRTKYVIAPLSNGNVSLLTNMAKNAGLPWDLILSAELFAHYKPDPETYLGATRLLSLAPNEVMLVAAHNDDLAAARRCGLMTAFVARPTEYGPHQKKDLSADQDWTFIVQDLNELAGRLSC